MSMENTPEYLPVAQPDVPQNALQTAMGGDFNAEKAIAQAEKRVEFLNRIVAVSLKRTQPGDWVNQQGKPYLQGSGAEKLKAIWGIYVKPGSIRFEQYDDDGHRAFLCIGTMGSNITHEESEFVGGRSGKDSFFAHQKNYDMLDLQKAAYTNFEVNGVTRLLGMRNLTWEQLKAAGLDQSKIGKVEYKEKGEMKAEAIPTDKLEHLGVCLMLLCDNEKDQASEYLREITTFEGKDGNLVNGVTSLKALKSEKQVNKLTHAVHEEMRVRGIDIPNGKKAE